MFALWTDKYPMMPAPDADGVPSCRPLDSDEASAWLRKILGVEDGAARKVSSHSCKCTCLSYAAKRGFPHADRMVLGYHSQNVKMALCYSRDSQARPLRLLQSLLSEIRLGVFVPDASRAGRLFAKAQRAMSDAEVASEEEGLNDTLQLSEPDCFASPGSNQDPGEVPQDDESECVTTASSASSSEDSDSDVVASDVQTHPVHQVLTLCIRRSTFKMTSIRLSWHAGGS